MAQLSFTKKTQANGKVYWESHTTVNADFNIHVEVGNHSTWIEVCKKISNTQKYAEDFKDKFHDVFDRDFHALVYPKYICVQTGVEPTIAEITEG